MGRQCISGLSGARIRRQKILTGNDTATRNQKGGFPEGNIAYCSDNGTHLGLSEGPKSHPGMGPDVARASRP